MIHKIRNIIIFYSLGVNLKESLVFIISQFSISINFLFIWRQRQSPHYHQTPKMAVTLLTESEKNIYYPWVIQPVRKIQQTILMGGYIWDGTILFWMSADSSVLEPTCSGFEIIKCLIIRHFASWLLKGSLKSVMVGILIS